MRKSTAAAISETPAPLKASPPPRTAAHTGCCSRFRRWDVCSSNVPRRSLVLACITTATFTDLVAYSVAVPVLPDYATRFHASPTMVGLLFGSFGVALLALSIPLGAMSDRLGRKGMMICALALLTGATLLFAYAQSLPMLFAARMLQGVADAATWVVGFALIADLYGEDERGRA